MVKYHAVMLDETGQEFGVDLEDVDKDHAHDQLSENYPESRVVQLESAEDTRRRENRMYDEINFDYEHGYNSHERNN